MLKSKQSRFVSVTGPKRPTTRPTLALSTATLDHEREVYSADPTGGSASRY